MDLQNINDIQAISLYIQSFGLLAPAIVLGLFIIQAAFPVFPYIIMATVSGLLFGFGTGFLLSWVGALLGACLAFWLCRFLGADWVGCRIERHFGYKIQNIDSETAFWTIVLARIIPVVPTPIINIASALSGVSFRTFLFSSAIGKIPTAILYTGLGLCLFKIQDLKIIISLLVIILLIVISTRYLKKANAWQ